VKQFGRYWLFFLVPKARTNTFYICQPCTCIIYIYYTLRFYFPYLSLLAQPVNITLYGPAVDCLVFESLFREIIGLVFGREV